METVVVRSHDGWTSTASVHRSPTDSSGPDDPHAQPLVLLHGLSQQRFYWDPVVRRLSARPVAALDQRGHGDSDADANADYSMSACATDVETVLDSLGWSTAVVVGHSWGAAVALAFAAEHPDRTAAAVLLDGGLWGPRDLGDPAVTRERLRPPALGIPEEQLWAMVRSGDLGPYWSSEVKAALAPTFVSDATGCLGTRIGMDRHMAVLDGLFAFDPAAALEEASAAATPIWVVAAEPRSSSMESSAPTWQDAGQRAVRSAMVRPLVTTLRIAGAVHDVPLQWPALVAGLLDTVATARSEE